MKRNVDLTLKRDFNSDIHNEIERKIILELTSTKVPWKLNNNLSLYKESDYTKNSILTVGSKIDRKEFKINKTYYIETCDRCGVPKTKIPWDDFGSLCKKCENDLKELINKNDKRICWR